MVSIKDNWEEFKRTALTHIVNDASQKTVDTLESIFYAGAISTFATVIELGDKDDAEGEAALDALDAELKEYAMAKLREVVEKSATERRA